MKRNTGKCAPSSLHHALRTHTTTPMKADMKSQAHPRPGITSPKHLHIPDMKIVLRPKSERPKNRGHFPDQKRDRKCVYPSWVDTVFVIFCGRKTAAIFCPPPKKTRKQTQSLGETVHQSIREHPAAPTTASLFTACHDWQPSMYRRESLPVARATSTRSQAWHKFTMLQTQLCKGADPEGSSTQRTADSIH